MWHDCYQPAMVSLFSSCIIIISLLHATGSTFLNQFIPERFPNKSEIHFQSTRLELYLLSASKLWFLWLQINLHEARNLFIFNTRLMAAALKLILNTLDICDRIWQKGQFRAFSEFSFLKVYNSETRAAIDLNFGMIILPTSCYTRKEFRALPISGVIAFENRRFMPHFGGSPLGTGLL